MALPPRISGFWRSPAGKTWGILLALQALIGTIVLFDFIAGRKLFAYTDVGNDTFFQFIPFATFFARNLATDLLPGWSFKIGLGANVWPTLDPFVLFNVIFGPDWVAPLRVWTYLLKLSCAGGVFLAFLLTLRTPPMVALAGALAYSFCGYAVINGQWDPHATELVFYALILWAIAHQHRHGGVWFVPLAVGAGIWAGLFAFSVGVFLFYIFVGCLLVLPDRRATLRRWLLGVWPQSLGGLLLAAPVLLPALSMVLDSPRVSGGASLYASLAQDLSRPNDWITVLSQIAGLFHKDLLGIGNAYRGWMNYLEGPEFFVGLLPLLLIPQLWKGDDRDRRLLVTGLAVLVFYIASPILRYAPFGFNLPYFRVSTLWVSLLLLLVFARAMTVVVARGLDVRLFAAAATVAGGLIGLLLVEVPDLVNKDHLIRLGGLAVFATAVLFVPRWKKGLPAVAALVAYIAVEAAVVAYPSFHEGRAIPDDASAFRDRDTLAALDFIKRRDPGFHRVEKTFLSVSLCDSLAQDYRGVKSYYFHGSGVAGFFEGMELIRPGRSMNYTNWLTGFQYRFMLYSVVGVKYVVSSGPLPFPGFVPVFQRGKLFVSENQLVLPVGVVHNRYVTRAEFLALDTRMKDRVMLLATVIDGEPPAGLLHLDPATISGGDIDEIYVAPANALRQRGLRVREHSERRLAGEVDAGGGGALVFSIPDYPGWRATVDGQPAKTYRANLGMIALDLPPGRHAVELVHQAPGRTAGMALAGLALVLLAVAWRRRWHPAPPPDDGPRHAFTDPAGRKA